MKFLDSLLNLAYLNCLKDKYTVIMGYWVWKGMVKELLQTLPYRKRPVWTGMQSRRCLGVIVGDSSGVWSFVVWMALDFVKRLLNKDQRKRMIVAQALRKHF
ncbi:hypothetical protein C5167_018704 [Papaver somniferum]|uniref:Uncharacterized protein n=1 Tax=Papaver somniferum TaxID=3469 RepID=A0A4Y7INM2_PAPSO|nr:hypothetical protein C5167_018704 [Papaver somniferum]